jgi:GNAT superfamily N-acetyltransferase
VSDLPALTRFFVASDLLLERVRPTWWGAVVTDSRFPDVYDMNYARVDSAQPELSLEELGAELVPAVRKSGGRHFHVAVFEPAGTKRLLDEMAAAGHRISRETPMAFHGPPPAAPAGVHEVEELDHGDEALWRSQRLVYRAFDVKDQAALEQLVRWAREVLAPAGRRWFGVRDGSEIAGIGSVQVRGGVAYVDDVVTFAPYRRRGIAAAIVSRIVGEARDEGIDDVVLLADEPGPIRLYERLGFRKLPDIASALSKLDEEGGFGPAD